MAGWGRGAAVVVAISLVSVLAASGAVPVAAQQAAGRVDVALGPGASADDLASWDTRIAQMQRTGSLVLRSSMPDREIAGRRTETFVQLYGGVPVYGAGLSRQTAGGRTISLLGSIYEGIDLPPTARLSAVEAQRQIEAAAAAPLRGTAPALVVLPELDGRYRLTYRATAADGHTRFIDAATGQVVRTIDAFARQTSVGRGHGALGDEKKISVTPVGGGYEARDRLRPAQIVTEVARGTGLDFQRLAAGTSPVATDADNDWTDAGVVDAHVHAGWTYDYFAQRMGWAGLDGRNGSMTQVVTDSPAVANNAFYAAAPFGPSGRGIAIFGSASGRPVTVLDIVGHELMHGVTANALADRTGEGLVSAFVLDGLGPEGLPVDGQMHRCDELVLVSPDGSPAPFLCSEGRFVLASNPGGAIDEAFSDVFGTSVEFFAQPAGSGAMRAEYDIGEDLPSLGLVSRGSAGPIRALRDPASLLLDDASPLRYPDHADRRYRFPVVIDNGVAFVVGLVFVNGGFEFTPGIDDGGVHWNATILGHAFYLAVEGGTNATSHRTVTGVGSANRLQIERVFFRAMTQLMPSMPTLATAAAALRQAAVDLYGATSATTGAVDQALAAVGL